MTLDWKWVGYGVLIMFGLGLVAAAVVAFFLVDDLPASGDPGDIVLTGGQLALAMLLNFLAFVAGGFIVGLKSAGRTVIEPAIAAAVAVAITLLLSGSVTVTDFLVSGLVPFLAGLLGGWLGERRQEARSNS